MDEMTRPETARPVRGLLFAGVLMLVLLGGAGVAGAYVVPKTAPKAVAVSASGAGPSSSAEPNGADGWDPARTGGSDSSDPDLPDPYPSTNNSGAPRTGNRGGRPADALAAWAVPLATRLGIPAIALQAYGYAELVLAQSTPTCKLSWTTLAGIGKIESDHGRGAGATLQVNGKALPPIIGVALDGQGGRDSIPDTDGGRLDGDRVWDRAVGPMQFIPSTWEHYAVDADSDGVADPNDIDDAALAAGSYLCASGRDMSTAEGWYASILTYNAVRAYANDVYISANDYGVRSRA